MFRNATRRKMMALALAAQTLIFISVAGPSVAGLAKIFRDSGLTPEDIEFATAAAKDLYTNPGVTTGETADWSNPKNGASGTVKVLRVDRTEKCVSFQHSTVAASTKQMRLTVRQCQNAAGDWILSP